MSDTDRPKKRGAPKKTKKMEGRIAFRSPIELEKWLESEGEARGLDKGTVARMFLMEIMFRKARGKNSEVK